MGTIHRLHGTFFLQVLSDKYNGSVLISIINTKGLYIYVFFRSTVVKDYQTYWIGVTSASVSVVRVVDRFTKQCKVPVHFLIQCLEQQLVPTKEHSIRIISIFDRLSIKWTHFTSRPRMLNIPSTKTTALILIQLMEDGKLVLLFFGKTKSGVSYLMDVIE